MALHTRTECGIKGALANREWQNVHNLKTATSASCSVPRGKGTSEEILQMPHLLYFTGEQRRRVYYSSCHVGLWGKGCEPPTSQG